MPMAGSYCLLPPLSLLPLGVLRNAVLNYYVPRPFTTSVYLIVPYKHLVHRFLGKKKIFFFSFSFPFQISSFHFCNLFFLFHFSYFFFPSCWLSRFFKFSFKNHIFLMPILTGLTPHYFPWQPISFS